jgi:hypothetical protein
MDMYARYDRSRISYGENRLLDPLSTTKIILTIAPAITKLIWKLMNFTEAMRSGKKECEELEELLRSIEGDVMATEHAVELCKLYKGSR